MFLVGKNWTTCGVNTVCVHCTVQHVDYSTVYIPTIDAWTTVRGHGLLIQLNSMMTKDFM